MPQWNLGELMSATTTALNDPPTLLTSTVSFWVNVAYEDVWSLIPHDQQETLAVSSTTVNEDKISLPSDFREIIGLSNLSRANHLLDPINTDQAMRWSSAVSGEPTHYMQYANWLELRPIPDSRYSLELRYRALRSDLTVIASVPSVATRLRPAILHRAVELLAQNVTRDPDTAATHNRLFTQNLMSMPSDRALRLREQHAVGLSLPRYRGQKTRSSAYSFDRST